MEVLEREQMKEIELEALAEYDGKDERPVYVVHQGRVFDVSQSRLWKGGLHMKRHHAGKDLTVDFGGAPHGTEVFERYPQVGVIKNQEGPEQEIPEILSNLLQRFPMLRRHPHPMTVHFPIVFMLSATAFNILYLITGIESLEMTAIHCLGAGVLFTPLVMATGLYTWWLNYMAKPIRPVKIKIVMSMMLLVISVIAFVWRVAVPGVLHSVTPLSAVYFLLILALTPVVVIIGWFGANLTFPIEMD
jgi:predicted heme/steroid binding protein/uncharacterized membrane protein